MLLPLTFLTLATVATSVETSNNDTATVTTLHMRRLAPMTEGKKRKQENVIDLMSSDEEDAPMENKSMWPDLSADEAETVQNLLDSSSGIANSLVQLSREDLKRLKPGQWLNDEVINSWFRLLKAQHNSKQLFFNTFFFTQLIGGGTNEYNYDIVKRWTKDIDIFALDRVFVPVNMLFKQHWTLVVIDMKKKNIIHYDSKRSKSNDHRNGVVNQIFQYLRDEYQAKKGKPMETNAWEAGEAMIPQQPNVYDCGVYTSIYAMIIANNLNKVLTKDDIQSQRKYMVAKLYQGSL